MRLPEMTSLQFVVVYLLFGGERSANELAADLAALGVRRSQPSLSRLIERMVVEGYVHIECRLQGEGAKVTRRHDYRVTDVGVAHWHAARDFFGSLSLPPPNLVPLETVPKELVLADRKTRDKHFKRELTDAFVRVAGATLNMQSPRRC